MGYLICPHHPLQHLILRAGHACGVAGRRGPLREPDAGQRRGVPGGKPCAGHPAGGGHGEPAGIPGQPSGVLRSGASSHRQGEKAGPDEPLFRVHDALLCGFRYHRLFRRRGARQPCQPGLHAAAFLHRAAAGDGQLCRGRGRRDAELHRGSPAAGRTGRDHRVPVLRHLL